MQAGQTQTHHDGSLPKSEAPELVPWAADAAKRAERISRLVANGFPLILKVTYEGRKALDGALAVHNATAPQSHWFGSSIAPIDVEYGGSVILLQSYKLYTELKQ